MKSILLGLGMLLITVSAEAQRQPGTPPANNARRPGYVELIAVGYEFFTQGKTQEAYTAALMAAVANPKGFESYALAAAVMQVRGEHAYAKDFVEKAMARADASQKAKLRDLAATIEGSLDGREQPAAPASALNSSPAVRLEQITGWLVNHIRQAGGPGLVQDVVAVEKCRMTVRYAWNRGGQDIQNTIDFSELESGDVSLNEEQYGTDTWWEVRFRDPANATGFEYLFYRDRQSAQAVLEQSREAIRLCTAR